MPCEFLPLQIPEVVLVVPRVFPDDRGAFWETFKRSEFAAAGIDLNVAQVSESVSRRGVVRGLHYQVAPHAAGKLVRVLTGSVFDVAVDLRVGSPTFGQHAAATLDADNRHMMWIPAGFAHGFCAMQDDTHFLYLQTAEYAPAAERGVHPLDPEIGVPWPLPVDRLLISAKDAALLPLSQMNRDSG